jgi:hypothetical protein
MSLESFLLFDLVCQPRQSSLSTQLPLVTSTLALQVANLERAERVPVGGVGGSVDRSPHYQR